MNHLERCVAANRRKGPAGVVLSAAGIVFLSFLASATASAQSSSALIQSASAAPTELSSSQTYAGAAGIALSPVRPGPATTVVLLLDTMTPASLDGVKTGVISLYGSLQGRPMRLAVLHQGSWDTAGPFSSRAALQRALEKIVPPDSSVPAAQTPPGQLFDALLSGVAQLGKGWSRVLLVGDFPALDPASVEYASAILLRAFIAQQVRVSWFAPGGGNDAWLPLFQAAGGTVEHTGMENFGAQRETGQHFFRVDWAPSAPGAGFITSRSVLSDQPAQPAQPNQPELPDQPGQVLLEVPDLAAAVGFTLPTVEVYAGMQSKMAEAAAALREPTITEAGLQGVRSQLAAALVINPLEPAALRLGVELYEKAGDYATAVKFGTSLTEVRPLDGAAYVALGHALWMSSDSAKAEAALKHAVELKVAAVLVAEDLARIRIALKDDKGAIPYLDQLLQTYDKRQDLWFLKAEVAERLKDDPVAIHALEQGLALGGAHVKEAGALLRLYLAGKQNDKAQELARSTTAALPPDAGVREEFAGILDGLQQKSDAIAAWKRVLELRPDSERAHYRIARLLLESGDARGAEKVAKEGLEAAPTAPNLYIVEADAMREEGRMYSARGALEQGSAIVSDPDLLAHLATVEDSYGGAAAEAYARLAEALKESSPERRVEAMERGFAVSVRDGDFKHAESFVASLQSAGRPEFRSMLGAEELPDSGTVIPGGIDALAFAAHAKEGIPPERFFSEYAQILIDTTCSGSACGKDLFAEGIQEHFQRIAALEALGKRKGNEVVITLSLANKEEKHKTEKVLGLLGIKLRTSKGELELDRGEKKSQAKKQETVSALAVDEIGLQEQLQAGKSFDLVIRDEWVPVYPNEKMWRESLYSNENLPGGFAGALLKQPKMALLYRGLSALNHKAITELLNAVPLRTLNDKYADLLYLYGPALALQGTHAAVPGGLKAEAIWTQFAGASPQQPGAFFRALLEHENGRLLAFFFALSELDRPHQAFFTASLERTQHYYQLFATSEDMLRHQSSTSRDWSFADLLRSVPLDDEGHVDFPGSAEVWTVAKGRNTSDAQTAKLLKKVSKAVAPDVEDEVILHLAQTRYKDKSVRHTELDNFLAVSHIDAHRTEQLSQESALMLAQHYADSSAAYSYFEDLTALDSTAFHQFFAAIDRIKTHPVVDANLQLGQLHALIEWICLLRQRQVLGDAEASKLFSYVGARFAAADVDAAYTSASLESARAILAYCQPPGEKAAPGEQIRRCFLGTAGNASKPAIAFRRVLEMQNAPSLDTLFSIYDAATRLAAKGVDNGEIAILEKAVAAIPSVELPKATKVAGKEKDGILRYDPSPIKKVVEQLRQKAAKHKPNPKDLQKESQELLAELEPQVTAALAGPLYAYFLRPTDLVVSNDALLLRKHHYFDFSADRAQEQMIRESEFEISSEGAGSHFKGGFAQFGLASGSAAAVGWKTSGPGSDASIAAEIAAIRGAEWDHLEESDQRLVSLRISVAREWIFQAARHPEEFQALSEETMGLLSLSRRADLLTGIEARAWHKVWDSVTLPDLFELGGQYLSHYKTAAWSSPVTAELGATAARNDGSRLSILGPIPYHSFGCSHPHMRMDAPYEEYERRMLPVEIAERAAEFKLFLVYRADGGGVDPASLSGVAEDLAARAFRGAQMNSFRDWRSLQAAYSSVSSADVKEALKQ